MAGILRVIVAIFVFGVAGCSSRHDGMTIYPLDKQFASLSEPKDAVKRFETEFRVKPGTGQYRLFVINGLSRECYIVVPSKETVLGAKVHHASREDVDVAYCYDKDKGGFAFRL